MLPMNTRTIRVQGKGNVSQTPDRIAISFSLTGRNPDFSRAVEICNEAIETLRKAAGACGIDPGELKTAHFDISEESKYFEGVTTHIGFMATHRMGIVLPIDREFVGRFLSAVIRSGAEPDVRLAFRVSDPEALRQKVLASAVENARRRAETIVLASGVKLGPIAHIEYGYAEVHISSQECGIVLPASDVVSDAAPNFDPDDIEAEDTVTITWEIGG